MADINQTRRSILKALGAGATAAGIGFGGVTATADVAAASGSDDCVACGDGDADKVGQLTFKFLGDMAMEVAVYNDKEKKDEEIVYGPQELDPGEEFTVNAPADKGEFETEISLYAGGIRSAQFHTSCSRPIGPGLVQGLFEIVDGRDSNGDKLCEVECGICGDGGDAKDISQLTFDYSGGQLVEVYNDKEAKEDEVLYRDTPNGEFTVRAAAVAEDKLNTDISVYVGGSFVAKIHTSCSQPLFPGMTVGPLTLVGGRTKNGIELCTRDELSCAECGVGDDDADGVTTARFQYTGDRTSGKIVVYNDKEAKNDAVLNEVDIASSGTTTVDVAASTLGEDKLKSDISVYVAGERNAIFHTSCSKPFGPGIQKGDVKVVEATTKMGRDLCEIDCLECGVGDDDADGVNSLTLEYVGDRSTGTLSVYNEKDPKADKFLGSIDLSQTTTIQFSAPDGEDKLNTDIGVFLGEGEDAVRLAKFHTSCSQPLAAGIQKGDVEVVDGISSSGAGLCPVDCVECGKDGDADGVRSLELRYNGTEETRVRVYNDNEDKEDAILFDQTVKMNETVPFEAPAGEDKLKSDISIYLGDKEDKQLDALFHTSCSQTIGPGVERGSFTVVRGRDKSGLTLCEIDSGDCVLCGDDGEAERPRELTLSYVGPEPDGELIAVGYNDKDDKDDKELTRINLKEETEITLTAPPGERELHGDVSIFVGGDRSATIHTSCSQPLGPGVRFGDFVVTSGQDKSGRNLCEIDCAVCGGDTDGEIKADGVKQLELGYLRQSPAEVRVYNDKEPKSDKLLFDSATFNDEGELDRGDTFVISASTLDEDKLKSDILFVIDGQQETLHTSCSRPLGPGVTTSGGSLVVTDGRDKAGLSICPKEAFCPPQKTLLARYEVRNGQIVFVEGREELNIDAEAFKFSGIQTNNGDIIGFTANTGPFDLCTVTVRSGNQLERFGPNDPDYLTPPSPGETTVVDLTKRVDGTPEGITEILFCAPVFWQIDVDIGEPPQSGPPTFIALAAVGTNPPGIIETRLIDFRERTIFDGLAIPEDFDYDFDNDTVSITIRALTTSELQEKTGDEDAIAVPIKVFLGSYSVPGDLRVDDELQYQVRVSDDVTELEPGETYTFEVPLPTP